MSDVTVAVPAKTFTDTVNLLRKIIKDHTETVQGRDTKYERCTVCSGAIKRYAPEHRMSDHCNRVDGNFCWVGDIVGVLFRLLS